MILILSLAAPVAAGPHEDARAATGYRPGFDPYSGAPAPLLPPGVDAHAIDKNGNPIPFKFDPNTGKRIGAQPAPQDPAALGAKAQEILDAQTKAAPDSQPPPLAPRVAGPAAAPAAPAAPAPAAPSRIGTVSASRSAIDPGTHLPRGALTPFEYRPVTVPAAPRIPAPSVGTAACQRYPNLC